MRKATWWLAGAAVLLLAAPAAGGEGFFSPSGQTVVEGPVQCRAEAGGITCTAAPSERGLDTGMTPVG